MNAPNGLIRIATRGSALALAQANAVLAQCREAFPGCAVELRVIKTTGDKLQTAALAQSDLPKGLFTKELEVALLAGEADVAVHSLKDLPTELPEGLSLGSTGLRADVRDALVYRHADALAAGAPNSAAGPSKRGFRPHMSFAALPAGTSVATSSTRRAAQLQAARPDVKIVPIRGNVGTRLRKLWENAELDATLLAVAGLERLSCQLQADGTLLGPDVPAGLAVTKISLTEMLPCVGQAAVGLEIRSHDERMQGVCARLNHPETFQCVTAERAFLRGMGGGCQAAVAAHAVIDGEALRIRAVSFLSSTVRRGERVGSVRDAAALGEALAVELRG